MLRISYCHRYLTLAEPAGCRSILNNAVELFWRESSLFDPVINNVLFILTIFYFSHAESDREMLYLNMHHLFPSSIRFFFGCFVFPGQFKSNVWLYCNTYYCSFLSSMHWPAAAQRFGG